MRCARLHARTRLRRNLPDLVRYDGARRQRHHQLFDFAFRLPGGLSQDLAVIFGREMRNEETHSCQMNLSRPDDLDDSR